MFIVPSVTMEDGSLISVTSAPLAKPISVQTATPRRIARYGRIPCATVDMAITIEPGAIAMPHDRPIPAVRITSVWPIARTPTTITCCRISEDSGGKCSRTCFSDCGIARTGLAGEEVTEDKRVSGR